MPEFPREVRIEGKGGVLALSGERKISIQSRGLAALEYEIARVDSTQINHLVSQTEGKFEDPAFLTGELFNEDNISRIALEHQPIAAENKWKANYSGFDFSPHLRTPADGGSERGLFFLTVRGWNSAKRKPIEEAYDRRFLLVTDLGIVVKKSVSGSSDVFLLSIKTGQPLAGATVEILGKNGIALQTDVSDVNGHVAFPSVDKSVREKTPVAFIARSGDDVAFMPYDRADRALNFSRFEIDGVENIAPDALQTFVFTERGIYRPGDEIHIGAMIKARDWSNRISGLPIEMEIIDARDLRVQTRRLSVPPSGFAEASYLTTNESPTGSYSISFYLVKNSKRSILLGSTTVTVKEFLPDRMKIATRLSRNTARGWIEPATVRGTVELANLYGTPATGRRVTGRLELLPSAFCFPEFRDFTFYDSLALEKKHRREQTIELGQQNTDAAGATEFDLGLERFADATYAMRFVAEGFEAEGGRSVTGDAGALVSALPYVVGWKADGDLRYINSSTPRALELIAVDRQLNRIAVENLTVNILAQEFVSVLTKQESGNYAYESVLKERLTQSEKISIAASGTHYLLPTTEPGTFVLELRDDQNRRVAQTRFCVAGNGTTAHALERNAELEMKLDRKECNSGDELAVSIKAPYAGAGLITIERDRVYAYRWFQASTATSVQHIRVPDDFEGSGYVNVTLVRALDAKEIFSSPLSYAVTPFTANAEKRRLKIELMAREKTRPGEPLHIGFKTDRPSKIVIFAVDQGILQVTDFKTPDPLAFFFRKCALGVQTSQVVDLIMPEFSLLRSASAFGGGEDAPHLNPFKRVTEKPVVFWSGLVDAGPDVREVVYDVPDFFSGTLTIMAVALSETAAGSAQREALVRGPFVITPSVPTLAAPGDQFETGVTVANNVEGSGENAEVELRAETSAHVALLSSPVQRFQIAEGREKTTTFRFRAEDKLGSGSITFIATSGNARAQLRSTLSIRPATPFATEVRSGSFDRNRDVPISRALYPEFAKREASVSALPLGLAHGLDMYLASFPHGCSEQLTSAAFCRLMLNGEADFGLSRAEVHAQLQKTFETLRRRQNDSGGFGYWAPESDERISFISVYVMDFLQQANRAGFPPPADMFASGLRNLQAMAAREPSNLSEARTLAYAIYLLTREGVVTTNNILNLRDYLGKEHAHEWENDLTAVYLAGALHLLHKDAEAEALISKYHLGQHEARLCDDFYQPLGADSQYLAVLAREFPERLKNISAAEFQNILEPIGEGNFNTLSAAYAVAALKAYSQRTAANLPELSMTEIGRDNQQRRLKRDPAMLQRTGFSEGAAAIRFSASDRISGPAAFFQVIEVGFDRQPAREAVADGLEVYRELLDKNRQPVTHTRLGEAMHVRLRVRSLRNEPVTNVAIVDLLPGGFEIPSLRPGVGTVHGVDYTGVREDRAIFFATVPTSALEIDYEIKSCNRGEFTVPPPFAASMYDRGVKGRGVTGAISVGE
ncbi:MAG: alpha-2-macroglobulin [Chthoniobacterales bacterium]|nr:MAG: alpha-2-macroglobulin [Chthoniobacterales bacterium]